MWPFNRKPKRIITKRYRAFFTSGAQRAMERDANKLAAKGYRLVTAADKSHKIATKRGDIFATYELIEPAASRVG